MTVALASVDAGVYSLSRSLRTREPVEKTVSGPEDMAAAGMGGKEGGGEDKEGERGRSTIDGDCDKDKGKK